MLISFHMNTSQNRPESSAELSYTVQYDAEAGLITASAQGAIDMQTLTAFVHAIVSALKEHNCRLVLNDVREVTVLLSTVQIYDLPDMIVELASAEGLEALEIKRALVAAGDLSDFSFFETVSLNRMHNIKIFRDMDKARAWLLEK